MATDGTWGIFDDGDHGLVEGGFAAEDQAEEHMLLSHDLDKKIHVGRSCPLHPEQELGFCYGTLEDDLDAPHA